MNDKIKLLYISSVLPDTSCGAHLAIYRHFVLRNDFQITVCGYSAEHSLTENKFTINLSPITKRLHNTRFSRLLRNVEYLLNWYWLPKDLLDYAKAFKPDVIITVPDNIHLGLAYRLSKKLGIPFVCNFQDLFPLSRYIARYMEPYSWVRKVLLKHFFQAHRAADLVFYTSEGMQLFFGSHNNGHVLYPVGDFDISTKMKVITSDSKREDEPITIVYAGNCYGAYGRMLLQFAKLVKNSKQIKFQLFPVGSGWPEEVIDEMRAAGIYKSFLPFEELKKELLACDALLTVMSFEPEEAPFVKTSFTTKWLDYAPFGKPIFVWGPDYSSGSIFAEKYNCGITVTDPNPEHLVTAIQALAMNRNEWNRYGANAKLASENVLNPNHIHSVLVNGIHAISRQE